jgi:hypothetical protein
MNNKHPLKRVAALLAAVIFAGCADAQQPEEITGTVDMGGDPTSAITTTTTTARTTVPTTTTTPETTTPEVTTATALSVDEVDVSADTTQPSAQEVLAYYETQFSVTPEQDYTLSAADNAFIEQCAFVGDSVFYGLFSYEFVESERVFAAAGVAARNLFDMDFRGQGIIDAVKGIDPEYVVFYMGMNDLNMTDIDTYVQNYLNLLAQFQEYKLMVVSVTPVNRDSWFTYNWKIDAYNKGIKDAIAALGSDRVCYIDVNSALKDANGDVRTIYDAGDGVHLNKAGYPALLWYITNMNPWAGTATEPAETPALTEAQTTTSPDLTTNDAIPPETESEPEPEMSEIGEDIEAEEETEPETEATTAATTPFDDVPGDNDDVDVIF